MRRKVEGMDNLFERAGNKNGNITRWQFWQQHNNQLTTAMEQVHAFANINTTLRQVGPA